MRGTGVSTEVTGGGAWSWPSPICVIGVPGGGACSWPSPICVIGVFGGGASGGYCSGGCSQSPLQGRMLRRWGLQCSVHLRSYKL
jgi:hypothetical protein